MRHIPTALSGQIWLVFYYLWIFSGGTHSGSCCNKAFTNAEQLSALQEHMLMHLAVARETARGLEKAHGTGLPEHTFAFYKDINITSTQWWVSRKKITLAVKKFVLVMVMDPIG